MYIYIYIYIYIIDFFKLFYIFFDIKKIANNYRKIVLFSFLFHFVGIDI